jgi:hypothetical protein
MGTRLGYDLRGVLIHVVQQGGGRVTGPEGAMIVRPAGDHFEQEAATMAGTWDFTGVPTPPPAGTVLLWTEPPTHSAIVTATGVIAGYNQQCVFPSGSRTGTRPRRRPSRAPRRPLRRRPSG